MNRLHPLSPVLRGWRVLAVFAAFAAQNSARGGDLVELAVITAAGIPVAIVYGYLSWRFTRFYIDGDNLRIDSGVLFRNQKQVPLARVQAVEIVRPLLGRVLGLAELRLDVAGGGKDARLSYLAEGDAPRLRAELLARAAGIDAATPEAPEHVLVQVPPQRLLLALLLSVPVLLGALWLAVSVVAAAWTREFGVLGLNLPVLFGFGGYVYSELVGRYGFTVAQSPDGLRLRSGLLDTRAQTVPPGRVQAVQVDRAVAVAAPGLGPAAGERRGIRRRGGSVVLEHPAPGGHARGGAPGARPGPATGRCDPTGRCHPTNRRDPTGWRRRTGTVAG